MKKCCIGIAVLAMLFVVACSSAASVCDFNGDNLINNADLVTLFAYIQIKTNADEGYGVLSLENVQAYARSILGSTELSLVRLPDVEKDDLSADSSNILNGEDVVLNYSYIQVKTIYDGGYGLLNFESVESIARGILGRSVSLSKFPNSPLGSSEVQFSVNGIKVD